MEYDLPKETFGLHPIGFVTAICNWLDGIEWTNDDDAFFHFVRAIKGYPRHQGLTAEKVFDALRLGPKTTARLAASSIDLRGEDGEVAFFDAWERIRFPMGVDPVEGACGLAGDGLILAGEGRRGRYSRFLTVAALLQVQVGKRPILLPVRKVAQYFPCEPKTISVWTSCAKRDGVLIKTMEHSFRSAGESRAAEYVLGLHRWDAAWPPKIAALLNMPFADDQVEWTRQQFAQARAA